MTPQTDATTLVVPLWAALTAFGGILGSLGVLVAWAFSTFESKGDAKEKQDRAREQYDNLDRRMSIMEDVIRRMSENVAYIRARVEPDRDR